MNKNGTCICGQCKRDIRKIAYILWEQDDYPDGEQIVPTVCGNMKLKDFHWKVAINIWRISEWIVSDKMLNKYEVIKDLIIKKNYVVQLDCDYPYLLHLTSCTLFDDIIKDINK